MAKKEEEKKRREEQKEEKNKKRKKRALQHEVEEALCHLGLEVGREDAGGLEEESNGKTTAKQRWLVVALQAGRGRER